MVFDTGVLLVCGTAMKQQSFYLPLPDTKHAVYFDQKRTENVFGRFRGFIMLFESCVIFELNKLAYII